MDEMSQQQTGDVQGSYDQIADEYARRLFDELEHKPFDCQLLDRLAAGKHAFPICELGCGPGHVARYLHARGVPVLGMDLSQQMVLHARQLNPNIEFHQADMRALEVENDAWDGIVSFYSIIHIPRREIVPMFREWRRVLRPEGQLLVAFHQGDSTIHLDEWWERKVSIDTFFFSTEEIVAALKEVNFDVEDVIERDPYPDVEYPSRRTYIFARKGSSR